MSIIFEPVAILVRRLIAGWLQKYLVVDVQALGVLGDVVLNNVEVRLDALSELLPPSLPFHFSRGFVREVRISIPWSFVPIHIRLDTVEIVVSTNEAAPTLLTKRLPPPPPPPAAAGGGASDWLTGQLAPLLARVLANVKVTVSNVVLKYRHRHVALVVALRSLCVASANPEEGWAPGVVEPQGPRKIVHKVVAVQDLSVMCDTAWGAGARWAAERAAPPLGAGDARRQSLASGSAGAWDAASAGGGRWETASVGAGSSASALPRHPSDRLFSEDPLLSKCTIVARARVMMQPDAADGGEGEGGEGEVEGDARAAVAAALGEPPVPAPAAPEVADPFAGRALALLPGAMEALLLPGPGRPRRERKQQCVTLLHVHVDSLDCSLSARQLCLLARVAADVAGGSVGPAQASAAPASAAPATPAPPRPTPTPAEPPDEIASPQGQREGGGGIVGWLWNTVTGEDEEPATIAPGMDIPPPLPAAAFLVVNVSVGQMGLVLLRHVERRGEPGGSAVKTAPANAGKHGGGGGSGGSSALSAGARNGGDSDGGSGGGGRSGGGGGSGGLRSELEGGALPVAPLAVHTVPVPILRLHVDACKVHLRLSGPPPFSAVGVIPTWAVFDHFLDVGAVRLLPWSEALDAPHAAAKAQRLALLGPLLLQERAPTANAAAAAAATAAAAVTAAAAAAAAAAAPPAPHEKSLEPVLASDDSPEAPAEEQLKAFEETARAMRMFEDAAAAARSPRRLRSDTAPATPSSGIVGMGASGGARIAPFPLVPTDGSALSCFALWGETVGGAAERGACGAHFRRNPYFDSSLFPELDADEADMGGEDGGEAARRTCPLSTPASYRLAGAPEVHENVGPGALSARVRVCGVSTPPQSGGAPGRTRTHVTAFVAPLSLVVDSSALALLGLFIAETELAAPATRAARPQQQLPLPPPPPPATAPTMDLSVGVTLRGIRVLLSPPGGGAHAELLAVGPLALGAVSAGADAFDFGKPLQAAMAGGAGALLGLHAYAAALLADAKACPLRPSGSYPAALRARVGALRALDGAASVGGLSLEGCAGGADAFFAVAVASAALSLRHPEATATLVHRLNAAIVVASATVLASTEEEGAHHHLPPAPLLPWRLTQHAAQALRACQPLTFEARGAAARASVAWHALGAPPPAPPAATAAPPASAAVAGLRATVALASLRALCAGGVVAAWPVAAEAGEALRVEAAAERLPQGPLARALELPFSPPAAAAPLGGGGARGGGGGAGLHPIRAPGGGGGGGGGGLPTLPALSLSLAAGGARASYPGALLFAQSTVGLLHACAPSVQQSLDVLCDSPALAVVYALLPAPAPPPPLPPPPPHAPSAPDFLSLLLGAPAQVSSAPATPLAPHGAGRVSRGGADGPAAAAGEEDVAAPLLTATLRVESSRIDLLPGLAALGGGTDAPAPSLPVPPRLQLVLPRLSVDAAPPLAGKPLMVRARLEELALLASPLAAGGAAPPPPLPATALLASLEAEVALGARLRGGDAPTQLRARVIIGVSALRCRVDPLLLRCLARLPVLQVHALPLLRVPLRGPWWGGGSTAPPPPPPPPPLPPLPPPFSLHLAWEVSAPSVEVALCGGEWRGEGTAAEDGHAASIDGSAGAASDGGDEENEEEEASSAAEWSPSAESPAHFAATPPQSAPSPSPPSPPLLPEPAPPAVADPSTELRLRARALCFSVQVEAGSDASGGGGAATARVRVGDLLARLVSASSAEVLLTTAPLSAEGARSVEEAGGAPPPAPASAWLLAHFSAAPSMPPLTAAAAFERLLLSGSDEPPAASVGVAVGPLELRLTPRVVSTLLELGAHGAPLLSPPSQRAPRLLPSLRGFDLVPPALHARALAAAAARAHAPTAAALTALTRLRVTLEAWAVALSVPRAPLDGPKQQQQQQQQQHRPLLLVASVESLAAQLDLDGASAGGRQAAGSLRLQGAAVRLQPLQKTPLACRAAGGFEPEATGVGQPPGAPAKVILAPLNVSAEATASLRVEDPAANGPWRLLGVAQTHVRAARLVVNAHVERLLPTVLLTLLAYSGAAAAGAGAAAAAKNVMDVEDAAFSWTAGGGQHDTWSLGVDRTNTLPLQGAVVEELLVHASEEIHVTMATDGWEVTMEGDKSGATGRAEAARLLQLSCGGFAMEMRAVAQSPVRIGVSTAENGGNAVLWSTVERGVDASGTLSASGMAVTSNMWHVSSDGGEGEWVALGLDECEASGGACAQVKWLAARLLTPSAAPGGMPAPLSVSTQASFGALRLTLPFAWVNAVVASTRGIFSTVGELSRHSSQLLHAVDLILQPTVIAARQQEVRRRATTAASSEEVALTTPDVEEPNQPLPESATLEQVLLPGASLPVLHVSAASRAPPSLIKVAADVGGARLVVHTPFSSSGKPAGPSFILQCDALHCDGGLISLSVGEEHAAMGGFGASGDVVAAAAVVAGEPHGQRAQGFLFAARDTSLTQLHLSLQGLQGCVALGAVTVPEAPVSALTHPFNAKLVVTARSHLLPVLVCPADNGGAPLPPLAPAPQLQHLLGSPLPLHNQTHQPFTLRPIHAPGGHHFTALRIVGRDDPLSPLPDPLHSRKPPAHALMPQGSVLVCMDVDPVSLTLTPELAFAVARFSGALAPCLGTFFQLLTVEQAHAPPAAAAAPDAPAPPPPLQSRIYPLPIRHSLRRLPVLPAPSPLWRSARTTGVGLSSLPPAWLALLNMHSVARGVSSLAGGDPAGGVGGVVGGEAGGYETGRLYTSDVVTWVAHAAWPPSPYAPFAVEQAAAGCAGMPAQRGAAGAPPAAAAALAPAAVDAPGAGAWWASLAWSYAVPVAIVGVECRGGGVHVPPASFVRMQAAPPARGSPQPAGVPVRAAGAPPFLACTLEMMQRHKEGGGAAGGGGEGDSFDARGFVEGWLPVASFRVRVAPEAVSASAPAPPAAPPASPAPNSGTPPPGAPEDAVARLVCPPPAGAGVSDWRWHVEDAPQAVGEPGSLGSTTWRLRWMEPALTASRPLPRSQPMLASSGPGVVGGGGGAPAAPPPPAPTAVLGQLRSPSYASLSATLAAALRFTAAWAAPCGARHATGGGPPAPGFLPLSEGVAAEIAVRSVRARLLLARGARCAEHFSAWAEGVRARRVAARALPPQTTPPLSADEGRADVTLTVDPGLHVEYREMHLSAGARALAGASSLIVAVRAAVAPGACGAARLRVPQAPASALFATLLTLRGALVTYRGLMADGLGALLVAAPGAEGGGAAAGGAAVARARARLLQRHEATHVALGPLHVALQPQMVAAAAAVVGAVAAAGADAGAGGDDAAIAGAICVLVHNATDVALTLAQAVGPAPSAAVAPPQLAALCTAVLREGGRDGAAALLRFPAQGAALAPNGAAAFPWPAPGAFAEVRAAPPRAPRAGAPPPPPLTLPPPAAPVYALAFAATGPSRPHWALPVPLDEQLRVAGSWEGYDAWRMLRVARRGVAVDAAVGGASEPARFSLRVPVLARVRFAGPALPRVALQPLLLLHNFLPGDAVEVSWAQGVPAPHRPPPAGALPLPPQQQPLSPRGSWLPWAAPTASPAPAPASAPRTPPRSRRRGGAATAPYPPRPWAAASGAPRALRGRCVHRAVCRWRAPAPAPAPACVRRRVRGF